jgi:hypothetical protein
VFALTLAGFWVLPLAWSTILLIADTFALPPVKLFPWLALLVAFRLASAFLNIELFPWLTLLIAFRLAVFVAFARTIRLLSLFWSALFGISRFPRIVILLYFTRLPVFVAFAKQSGC